jgi:hypothetical protein
MQAAVMPGLVHQRARLGLAPEAMSLSSLLHEASRTDCLVASRHPRRPCRHLP